MNDKTDELVKELNGLKDAMVENLDKLIERDGKIEVILQKAESLSTYSKTYRQNVIPINPNNMTAGQKGKNSYEEQETYVPFHTDCHSICKNSLLIL